MKRIIPVLLVLVLFISCMVSPVSATTYDNLMNFWDLLEYDTLSYPRGNQFTVVGDYTFSWDVPQYLPLGYVDILCSIGGGNDNIQASVSQISGASTSLNVVQISTNLYRIYGKTSYRTATKFDLTITSDTSENRAYCFFYIKFSSTQDEFTTLSSQLDLYASGYNSVNQIDAGSFKHIDLPYYSSDTANIGYVSGSLWVNDWVKYDYISFDIGVSPGYGFSSLQVFLDGEVPVPFTTTYTNYDVDGLVDGDFTYSSATDYYITVIVDLTGVSRSDHENLCFTFNGSYNISVSSRVFVSNVMGFIDIPEPSKFQILLNKLEGWFGSLLDGSDENQSSADGFNESASDQSNELAEMSAVMNSVEAPDMSGVNMQVGSMVDTSVVTLTTTGISDALSNDILIRVLIMAITLAVAGFILYGKK